MSKNMNLFSCISFKSIILKLWKPKNLFVRWESAVPSAISVALQGHWSQGRGRSSLLDRSLCLVRWASVQVVWGWCRTRSWGTSPCPPRGGCRPKRVPPRCRTTTQWRHWFPSRHQLETYPRGILRGYPKLFLRFVNAALFNWNNAKILPWSIYLFQVSQNTVFRWQTSLFGIFCFVLFWLS